MAQHQGNREYGCDRVGVAAARDVGG
jgi:hypothetical protein